MRHFHPTAQHGQDVAGQHGFCPQIERLIQWFAFAEPAADVYFAEQRAEALASAKFLEEVPGQQSSHFFRAGGESLDPGWYEAEHPPDGVERTGFAVRQQE